MRRRVGQLALPHPMPASLALDPWFEPWHTDQLMPVSGYALHTSLVAEDVPADVLKALNIAKGKQSINGADRKGVALLRGFKHHELTQQMRAADDEAHARHLEQMRDTTSQQPVSDEFIASLQRLTTAALAREAAGGLRWKNVGPTRPAAGVQLSNAKLAAALLQKTTFTTKEWQAFGISGLKQTHWIKSGASYFQPSDEALRFAKIGVLSQRERHALNYSQARAFAKFHNRPFFWWRQELTGIASEWINEEETERLYAEEMKAGGLCGVFVEGAPGSITFNIETGSGLVNGCDATMHSLTLPTTAPQSLADYILCGHEADDGVFEVEIPAPFAVNAVPHISGKAAQALLARKATLDPDGRKLIVPVLIGGKPDTYRPTSVYAAQAAIPKQLRIKKHQIDLAFAVSLLFTPISHPERLPEACEHEWSVQLSHNQPTPKPFRSPITRSRARRLTTLS